MKSLYSDIFLNLEKKKFSTYPWGRRRWLVPFLRGRLGPGEAEVCERALRSDIDCPLTHEVLEYGRSIGLWGEQLNLLVGGGFEQLVLFENRELLADVDLQVGRVPAERELRAGSG